MKHRIHQLKFGLKCISRTNIHDLKGESPYSPFNFFEWRIKSYFQKTNLHKNKNVHLEGKSTKKWFIFKKNENYER